MKITSSGTRLKEYFSQFIREQVKSSRSRYTGAITLFSAMLGRPALLSDLAGDADVRFREYAKSRGFADKTADNKADALRALWKQAAELHDVTEWPVDHRLAPTLPEQWHNKPRHHQEKKCPICGYPARLNGLHRLATPGTAKRKWFKRTKTADGFLETEVGQPFVRKLNRMPYGPTPRVLKLIAQAATMQAAGKLPAEIAKELGVKPDGIRDWRIKYRDLWDKAFDRAMEQNLILVREQAGTAAVLEKPGEAMARERLTDRWAKQHGKQLWPVPDKTTLTAFYATYYRPNCLADNCDQSRRDYEVVMRAWRVFTGDPPLEQITVGTLALFRDCVSKLPNRNRLSYISPNTVRSYLRHLQAVLDKAGPPGRRNRDAAGLLQVVPWVKPPRETINPPRMVSLEDLSAAYLAAACMDRPRIEHVKPPAWWRLLLVLAFNTGFRRRTLFALRMEHIDWQGRKLSIPAEFFKSRRGQNVPLNDVVMQHLLATRTDRQFVLEWEHDWNCFYYELYRLQECAGIPKSRRFGLHAIRKTAATILWGDSPQAAQLMMGHGAMDITRLRYVAGASILRQAADSMPQPEAFTDRKDGAA